VVKMIGDEVFFAAPTADAAVGSASNLSGRGRRPPPAPGSGSIGYGLVDAQEGDFFARLVN